MAQKTILIVEDEVLIADNISRFLTKRGFRVLDIAISFEEAQQRYRAHKPDLVLLDIRLYGDKTGIDFAHYLRQEDPAIPFIYLTSQSDKGSIEAAKETFPAGYLAKPVNKESLYATVEVALHRFHVDHTLSPTPAQITLFDGKDHHRIQYADILYLEAEHVYVKVYLQNGSQLTQRSSLSELLADLPTQLFVRTHRSYAVNINAVSRWETDQLYIGSIPIVVSRSRRKEVLKKLNS